MTMAFRFALRSLLRSPWVTAGLIINLGVGLGASSAIFAIIDAVFLKNLAVSNPSNLAFVWHSYPKLRADLANVSVPSFLLYQRRFQSFDQLAAFVQPRVTNLAGENEPSSALVMPVTPNFFTTLRSEALLGRTFNSGDGTNANQHLAILSFSTWQRMFGGSPEALGKKVYLNSTPFVVVGVMPREFQAIVPADLWTPLIFSAAQSAVTEHGNEYLTVFGALRPGQTISAATQEAARLTSQIRKEYPKYYSDSTGWRLKLVDFRSELIGSYRSALLLLEGCGILLFAIGCVNAMSLTLVRTVRREGQMATQLALGDTPAGVAKMMGAETLICAALAILLAIAVEFWTLSWLRSYGATSELFPPMFRFAWSWEDAAFATVLAIVITALSSLVPYRVCRRFDLATSLREAHRSTIGWQKRRSLNVLVISEVAIATILLAATSWASESYLYLKHVPLGFSPQRVLTMQLLLPRAKYTGARVQQLYDSVLDSIRDTPGIQSAGLVSDLPLFPSNRGARFEVENHPETSGELAAAAAYRIVSDGYFETMGIPLRKGRGFNRADSLTSEPVIALDANAARRYWPSENPIGHHVRLTFEKNFKGEPVWRTVVAVVGHVRDSDLQDADSMQLYVPRTQALLPPMFLVVRSREPDEQLALASVRQVIRSIDPQLPLHRVATMDQVVDRKLSRLRLGAELVSGIAVTAFLFAVVGLGAILSYLSMQRVSEMAIRYALGGTRSHLFGRILYSGVLLTATGLATGLLVAFPIRAVFQSELVGTSALDLQTFLLIPCVIFLAGSAAASLSAWRSLRDDPAVHLRTV
jgi:putative ABC transport system permease protein